MKCDCPGWVAHVWLGRELAVGSRQGGPRRLGAHGSRRFGQACTLQMARGQAFWTLRLGMSIVSQCPRPDRGVYRIPCLQLARYGAPWKGAENSGGRYGGRPGCPGRCGGVYDVQFGIGIKHLLKGCHWYPFSSAVSSRQRRSSCNTCIQRFIPE